MEASPSPMSLFLNARNVLGFFAFFIQAYLFRFFLMKDGKRTGNNDKECDSMGVWPRLFIVLLFYSTSFYSTGMSLPLLLMVAVFSILFAHAWDNDISRSLPALLFFIGVPFVMILLFFYIFSFIIRKRVPPEDVPITKYPRNKKDLAVLTVAGYVFFALLYAFPGLIFGGLQSAILTLRPWSVFFVFFSL